MAAEKSLEVQMQVRQNADEYKNTLNDLFTWEKDVKNKEHHLIKEPHVSELDSDNIKTPIRSHISANKGKMIADSEASSSNNKEATVEPYIDPREKKHKEANQLKDRGNECVKKGAYDKAIFHYSMAIDIFKEDPIYFANRALCHLKLEKFEECIQDCDQAIGIDKLAVKAYYRRMQANEALGNNIEALKDCTTALSIEPKNKEARASLERINDRLKKNAISQNGPNFTQISKNLVDILPIEKPPYKRSSAPLTRVPVIDVVCPKGTKNSENSNLRISDEDIDKIFNSNCGSYIEVKKPKNNNDFAILNGLENQIPKSTKEQSNKKNSLKEFSQFLEDTKYKNKNHVAHNKKEDDKFINETYGSNEDSNKVSYSDSSKKIEDLQIQSNISKPIMLPPKILNKQITEQTRKSEHILPPEPTCTAQFYSYWKELLPEQKYKYLKSIKLSNLCRVLGAGFDSDTLSDVLQILRDFYVPNKDPSTEETLLEISKNKQVKILSLLLSKDDSEALNNVLNTIKGDSSKTNVQLITRNFNLC